MPVLFSLLVAGNTYENISRVGFINNFGSETAGLLRENYLYPDNGQDYRYFLILRYRGYLKPLLPKFKGNVARVK